jgi:hypothetical protein
VILQLDAGTPDVLQAAGNAIEAITREWGHPVATSPAPAQSGDREGKNIDPVALASLVVSIPSAALAVMDLADRITKRKRAAQLIGQARHLEAQNVTVTVLINQNIINLTTLTPDQLLDFPADDEDPAR